MLPPTDPDQCDDACTMPVAGSSMRSRSLGATSVATLVFNSIPLLLTFAAVALLVQHKVFPRLSKQLQKGGDAPVGWRGREDSVGSDRTLRRRVVAVVFSTTIALAVVLAELIFFEISNWLNPAARVLALTVTIPTLLLFLIVLIPFLEIQSVVSGLGWSFKRLESGGFPRKTWGLQAIGFVIWLGAFWWLGKGVPGTYIHQMASQSGKGLTEACLERVGIIGIALMALLSGFAAVSASWQTFGAKIRPVSTTDVSRKQAGLEATNDMLQERQKRLRAVQRKLKDMPTGGFVNNLIGSIRGNEDSREVRMLEAEISNYQSLSQALSNSVSLLSSRLDAQQRAASPLGRYLFTPASYTFSIYCIYRIATTVLTVLRGFFAPPGTPVSSSTSDPINRMLGLLVRNVDPSLDQLAWSRQISFLLSFFILAASFNSVRQTSNMLTKHAPSLLYTAQANLALLIAQISATYVISSALLLRSNLPPDMKSVISAALGSPLEPGFVERWFEGWFLLASIGTAAGIFISRKIGGGDEWDEWDGDVEVGQKRS